MKKRENKAENVTAAPNPAKKKRIIIIISLVLAVLIVAATVMGIVVYKNQDYEPFDYVGEDLSKYIYISDANYTGYKGYEITVATDEIGEKTVESTINRLLASNRGAASNSGVKERNAELRVGDDINLFFRAFVKDENGQERELSAFSNFSVTEEKKRTYTLGAGSLDSLGLYLELALVGRNLSEYSSCTVISEKDLVKPDDIVYITYDALYDGTRPEHGRSVRVDLSDENVNAQLKEYLTGKAIGTTQSPKIVFSADDGSTYTYKSITFERVLRFTEGKAPIEVETRVPTTYSDVSMQGKKITFELYVDYAVKYKTPAFDDTFVTETLEVKAEELSEYEGETLADKYRSYVYDYLKKSEEAEIASIRIQAMWSHLYSIAEIKKLPEDEVKRLFGIYKEALEAAYNENPGEYKTFDEYANAYVAYLGASTTWKDYFTAEAEAEVKQKLIFYYVAKKEGLLPAEGQMDSLYRELVEKELSSYLLQTGTDREDYETDAAYDAAVGAYRAQIEAVYSDIEYRRWVIHLEYAEEKMSMFGKVVYKNPAEE